MDDESFASLLRSRHTTRGFLSDPIPPEVLDQILEDARYCPSWSNTRPYALAIASGERLARLQQGYGEAFDASMALRRRKPKAILKALRGEGIPSGDFKAWKPYPKELLPRSRKIGGGLYAHMGIKREDIAARDAAARRNVDFFGAPTVIWIFVHKALLPFSAMDAGIMMQTLILAAKARGVDSCPLGVLSLWRHPIEEEFEIPKDYGLITGLALGYASDDHVNDFRADHPPLTLLKPKP